MLNNYDLLGNQCIYGDFYMETKKTVINALVESEPFSFNNDGKRKRTVAAYCRVSKDEDEQLE